MKLNNKGLTLVELIISFAILSIIVFSMLGTVISIKRKASAELFAGEMQDYKNTIIKDVEDVLIMNDVADATCTNNNTCTISFYNSEIESVTILVNSATKNVSFDNINYPIPNKEIIEFGNIVMAVEEIDDTRSLIVIKAPYYEKGDPQTNYGFEINHPFVKREL